MSPTPSPRPHKASKSELESLLRQIAEQDPTTGWDSTYCSFCMASLSEPHETDCRWAQARRLLGLAVPTEVGAKILV
jgi:hypothetical protein